MMAVYEKVSSSPSSKQEEEIDDSFHVYPVNKVTTINAVLDTRELWQQFDALGTEMIVTRRGRRMFPPIKVELHNLNPTSFYVLLMDLVPFDKYRYKYQNSKWVKCFEEACAPTRLYIHPESPALGSYWMDHIISFYKLKLTNNQLDKEHIIVNSMHRYQPRLHIVESSDRHNLNWDDFHTIVFPGTQFTTVTAYQNDKITQLKIENNPFAKGFRQPMSRNRSRPIKYSGSLLQSSSEAGSDDSASSYSNPVVCPSLTPFPQALENNLIVGSLKRHSIGSDDEIVLDSPSKKKVRKVSSNEEGLVHVTTHENPILPPTVSPPSYSPNVAAPVYVVYTNGEVPPQRQTIITPKHISSSPPSKLITQNGSSALQLLPINPFHKNGSISSNGILETAPMELENGHHNSSSDTGSSDSESDCEPSPSINEKPKTKRRTHHGVLPVIQRIHTPNTNILTLPQQNIIAVHAPSVINGAHHPQQILVPISSMPSQDNHNVFFPTVLGPATQVNGTANVIQLSYSEGTPVLQTVPLVVNSSHSIPSAASAAGRPSFQLVAFPGATSPSPQVISQQARC